MKQISMLVIALLAAVTMSATVVSFDFTNSSALTAMGVGSVPEAGKSWDLGTNSLALSGVTLTGEKVASTDNRIYNSNGNLSFRVYKTSKITFAVTGSDVIKGLIFDGTIAFDGVENGVIATNAATVTLTCTTNSTIKSVKVYVNEDLPKITVDTISVSEACARINKGEKQACYIKGVVAGSPFLLSSKYYTVWLTDINNPSDSIQAYKMRPGKAATGYASLDEMNAHYGLQDTVMIMAEGLDLFKSTYETTSGYYVETLGKCQSLDGNTVFPYAFGAVQMEMVEGKYRYEIVLSKEEDVYENALHYVIRTSNEKGIAGTHSVYKDSSYVDGQGALSGGSLKIAYDSEGDPDNKYSIVGDFTVGGVTYHMDTTYALAGYPDAESDEPFKLVDDVPFVPQEGDTITCAQAVSYAQSLGESTGVTVYVRGFATGFAKIDGRTQQSVYMADDSEAEKGIFQAYLCYTQNLDSIVKGDEILAYGAVTYYASKSQAQISKGKIYRIGGSDTKRPRDPQIEALPAGAITVAQALEIGGALTAEVGQTAETAEEYIVAGYIVDVNRQMSKDSATWYMADVKGEYGEFKAYKSQIKSLICEDDMVYVKGKISKYQVSAEVASIEISKGQAGFVNSLPSSLEKVAEAAKQMNVKKVIIDGQLYIQQNGVLYNALGTMIK